MTIYTVHAPADLDTGGLEAIDRIRFVKEGFCWPALFVPALWMIFRRLWIVLALYLAAGILIASVSRNVGPEATLALGLLLALFLLVEGNDLRRWTLRRRGLAMIDVVEAGSRDEAEIRFFHGTERSFEPVYPEPYSPLAQPTFPTAPASPDIIGLFPTAGGAR
jgi:hypothetical protein